MFKKPSTYLLIAAFLIAVPVCGYGISFAMARRDYLVRMNGEMTSEFLYFPHSPLAFWSGLISITLGLVSLLISGSLYIKARRNS